MTIVPITSPLSSLPDLPDLADIGNVAGAGAAAPNQPAQPANGLQSFGQMLTGEISKVEQSQTAADAAQNALATGQTSDIASVALQTDKAAITLDLAATIRNQVLAAFQTVNQMNV